MWKYMLLLSAILKVCPSQEAFELPKNIPQEKVDEMKAKLYANRFTFPTTATTKLNSTSTTTKRTLNESCDYLAFFCLRAYDTGVVCGVSVKQTYFNFTNYCMLDYINCLETYDVWQIRYMGYCLPNPVRLPEYEFYPYDDDLFLDEHFVADVA